MSLYSDGNEIINEEAVVVAGAGTMAGLAP
jgi:hypothetical protein